MADPRPSMVYVQPAGTPEAQPQNQPAEQPTKPSGGMKAGMEKTIHTAWTILCFVVFCTCSFFMGWHLKGWHFSAYYESPANGSYLGAKPASISVPVEPDPQISQASPENKQ